MQQGPSPPKKGQKRRRQTSAGSASITASNASPAVVVQQHRLPQSSSSSPSTTDTESSYSHVPAPSLSSGHAFSHSATPDPHQYAVSTTGRHSPILPCSDNDGAASLSYDVSGGVTEDTPRGRPEKARKAARVFQESPTRAPMHPRGGPSRPSTGSLHEQSAPSHTAIGTNAHPPPPSALPPAAVLMPPSLIDAWIAFVRASEVLQNELQSVRDESLQALSLAEKARRDAWSMWDGLRAIEPGRLNEGLRPTNPGGRRSNRWRAEQEARIKAMPAAPTSSLEHRAGDASRGPTLSMRLDSLPPLYATRSPGDNHSALRTDSPVSPYPPSSASGSTSGSREQSITRAPSSPFPSSHYHRDPDIFRPEVQHPSRSTSLPPSNPTDAHQEGGPSEPTVTMAGSSAVRPGMSSSPSSPPTLGPVYEWRPQVYGLFMSPPSPKTREHPEARSPFNSAASRGSGPSPPVVPRPQPSPFSTSTPEHMTTRRHALDSQGSDEGTQAGPAVSRITSQKGKGVARDHRLNTSQAAGPSRSVPAPLPQFLHPSSYRLLPTGVRPTQPRGVVEAGQGNNTYQNPTTSFPCPACRERFEFAGVLILHVENRSQSQGPSSMSANTLSHVNLWRECQRAAEAEGTSWQNYLVREVEQLTSGGKYLPGGSHGVPLPP